MQHTSINLAALDAASCWVACTPAEEAHALYQLGDSVGCLLGKLEQAGHWPEALKLLAHALPRPVAIAWALQCAGHGTEMTPAEQAALAAAVAWQQAPDEHKRRSCFAAAQEAGLGSAAGCSALAVFWSGGSISPPDAPPIEPAAHLCAHAAACAVQMSGVKLAQLAEQHYRQCLEWGRGLAVTPAV